MRRVLILLLLGCCYGLSAQNITAVEYFFDTDPGYGSGVAVSITPAATLTNLSFSADISALSNGFHYVFLRTQDANSNWSLAYSQPFYKLSATSIAAVPNINKLEYFIDADPGYGAGTDVPVTPGTSIANQLFTVPLATTATGFHTLFIRSRDANGNWSDAFSQPFYKLGATSIAAVPNINKLEYFIDADPGYGAGTDVPVTPGTSIANQLFTVPLAATATGFHTLFIRTRDANGNWSDAFSQPFYKLGATSIAAVPNINKLEYFIDADPGYGAGTDVPVTPGTSIANQLFTVPLATTSTGFHTLFIRTRDANGNWSDAFSQPFYKLGATSIASVPNINKLEYFIDADPGYGAGTDVPVTPGTSITNQLFAVPLATTATGFHTLFIRSRDANGNWSDAFSQPFYKLSSASIAAVPNLTKLEYFIDDDPGYGAGVDVPITPALSIPNDKVAVPVSSVAEGTHLITFRAKDANGNWSVVAIQNFSKCNFGVTTALAATSVNATGFTAIWQTVSGATNYQLDVSQDNFATYVSSSYNSSTSSYDNYYTVNSPDTSYKVTGLSQATSYQYRVRAVGSCVAIASDTIPVTTKIATPSYQPYSLSFSSVTATSLTASFYAYGSGYNGTGFLAVRSIGAATTFVPADNVAYTKGQTVGDGAVAAYAPAQTGAVTFNETGLTPNTNYYYTIFALNQIGSFISYLTTSPLVGNQATPALPPSAQPTNLKFTAVSNIGFTIGYTAPATAPDGYLVLRQSGKAPVSVPVNGTAYTQGSYFDYTNYDVIAFAGSATSFSETTLTQNTDYFYTIYSYNGSGSSITYRTTSPLQGDQFTSIAVPSQQASDLVFSNTTTTSYTVSYTASTSSVAGYLVIRNTGSSPTFGPQVNGTYTQGQVLTGGIVAYVGTSLTFNETGLTPGTTYYYTVFDFNQSGALIGYQTVSPLTGNISTLAPEPTAQPTSLSFNNITTTTLSINYVDASPVPDGYLVLRASGSAPGTPPADGTAYSAGDAIGTGTVVQVGTTKSANDNGLSPGTNYFYQVFSFNGSGAASNYLSTVGTSNSGSTITVSDAPVANAATAVQQDQFTANWSAATGAASYKLDVSSDNFTTTITGFGNLTVSGTSKAVTGLSSGALYAYRVRAVNASGTSVNSDTIQQYTRPDVPVIAASTDVGQTSFTANWNSIPGATNYYVDVSSDGTFNPSSILPNYNNTYATTNSLGIYGLTAGNTYYYRVSSSNLGGTSAPATSNQLMVPATPIGVAEAQQTATSDYFAAEWLPANGATEYRLDVSSDNFATFISGYSDLADVTGIVAAGSIIQDAVNGLTASTSYQYRVRAVNASGASPNSQPIIVRTQILNVGGVLPPKTIVLPTGGTVKDYVIISIPQLTAANTTTLTSTLTSSSFGSNWRLMHWDGGPDNVDVKSINDMQAGLGYWINSNFAQAPSITVNGTSSSNPGTIILKPGWNEIGNPFAVTISWNDVLVQNNGVQGIDMIDSLYVYNVPGVLSNGFKINDRLRAYGGGFVNNKNTSTVTLTVPLTVKTYSGSRMASSPSIGSDLSSQNWFVPLKIKVGELSNEFSGFGMHQEAKPGIDKFDGVALPRFFDYAEISTHHPEFFEHSFTKDIVTTATTFDWTYTVSSNSEDHQSTLSWDNNSFGDGSAQLLLYDVTSGILVDMKRNNSYSFQANNGHTIKFFFSADGTLSPDITGMGQPYPNPFSTQITIPFVTNEANENIQLSLYDMVGKPVRTLLSTTFEPGYHETQWDARDDAGNPVAPAVYIYRFSSSASPAKSGKIVFK